jgi:hypothetical protein
VHQDSYESHVWRFKEGDRTVASYRLTMNAGLALSYGSHDGS